MVQSLRTISYHFKLEDNHSLSFELIFDPSHRIIPHTSQKSRAWTQLEFNQCPHCPLKSAESPHCPVAVNLDEVVEAFKETLSFTKVRVTVEAPERDYVRESTAQEGLRSIFGLVMASSGCPHLDWLRPLARFHLPFGSIEETLFRVLSLQLVKEFLNDELKDSASSTKNIQERYLQVEKVNHAFIKRIQEYCKADADKNAMAALDIFVQFFAFHQENKFSELRQYFS